jgi:hypothetical protein
MIAQSLSIDVPGNCPNNCAFCVSRLAQTAEQPMLGNIYTPDELKRILKLSTHDMRLTEIPYFDAFERLAFARNQNVETVVLTGTRSEPLANKLYLDMFFGINNALLSPFRNIELQTSGVLLAGELAALRKKGVKTIALSISSLDDEINTELCQMKEHISIRGLCQSIKEFRFNLRLCLNINSEGFEDFIQAGKSPFDNTSMKYIQKSLRADQLTFRRLYCVSDSVEPENQWVWDHRMPDNWWESLKQYIQVYGNPLQRLPFGAMKYSLDGMSVVLDNDSMGEENYDVMKYLIFRRNGKLYTRWNDPASLIF